TVRAHYGLTLLAQGQKMFAREQLERVDMRALSNDLRARYATAAVTLLYDANDLDLASLSCRHQRSLRTETDETLAAWVALALPDVEGQGRYDLLEVQLALAIIDADYEQAVVAMGPL